MSIGDFKGKAEDPAALFLMLWDQAANWSHTQRSDATRRPDITPALKEDLLIQDDGKVAAEELIDSLLAIETAHPDSVRGSILDAMAVIDEVFDAIHPRHPLISPARAPRPRLPVWLVEARENRTLGYPFARDDQRNLLPRGPFTASVRAEADLNGETLEDRFVALTAAPRFLHAQERRIEVRSEVFGYDAFSGVPAGITAGREVIGVVAIAERAEDLEIERRDRNGSPHLDIRVKASIAAGDRFFDGVRQLGPIDIAMAPELTLSEGQAIHYANRLPELTGSAPRLSVAGSGGSENVDDRGRRENLSIMYNASGRELWRHRKIWPYNMTSGQVDFFKWDPINAGQTLAEDMIDGDSLTVADIDSLGRVVTLICQDFEIQPLVAETIRLYQPDWVLVPILDSGTDFNRWPHRTATRLSVLSNARFVVASSLALADQAKVSNYAETPVAILVGPHMPVAGSPAGETPRVFASIRCTLHTPMCGRLVWGEGDGWSQAVLKKDKH